jgi:DNA-binding XRE family transcriptional regulator
MAGHSPTKKELKERADRAKEIKQFMKDNLFTEVKLAEVLEISRRSLQMIKAGNVTPRMDILRKWNTLKNKYDKNKKTKKIA